MLGKTHAAIGTATALLLLQPQSVAELGLAMVAGAIGSEIADIDSSTSNSHKKVNLICLWTVFIVALAAACDIYWKVGIFKYVSSNSNYLLFCTGLFAFIGICMYGKSTKHRTFMHSLLGLVTTSFAVTIACPKGTPYFMIAYLTHILLDLLNKKKVQIFYPLKKGICLNLCRSDGKTNDILGYIGIILIWVEVYLFVKKVI